MPFAFQPVEREILVNVKRPRAIKLFLNLCIAEYVTGSYVCLGGRGSEHGSFEKQLSLPWKTELFKNVLPVSSEDNTS